MHGFNVDDEDFIKDFDIVIALAAVSNDPIGKEFEEATYQINFESTCRLAVMCEKLGVKKFIFASLFLGSRH